MDDFINRLKDAFDTMVVFKDLQQNNFISSLLEPISLRKKIGKTLKTES